MGFLVDGQWVTDAEDTRYRDGRFHRADARFRNWVTADGSSGFPAESGRYHLYVSLACPWAHRTLIFRTLKGLEPHIGVSRVSPLMLENGWELPPGADPVNGARCMWEVYRKADPHYTGRASVPVLWDRVRETIVSNESSEIIRMFNSAFDAICGRPDIDFWPEALRGPIEGVNEEIYHNVNNGVYKTGFATRQDAYEEACRLLFQTLDRLESRLGATRYLVGERMTEADWRLFTTLVRFDAVYHGHFKCNQARLIEYPALWAYVRDLYQVPGVAETTDLEEIRTHYYGSHRSINPTGIVAVGPPDLSSSLATAHGREALPGWSPFH